LEIDNALQRHVSELRGGYLRAIYASTSGMWRTPPTDRFLRFPGSDVTYRYAYDRQHTPLALQARLHGDYERVGRTKGGMLCASGMAAIDVLVKTLSHVLPAKRFRIAAFASYYETHTLFRVSSIARRWRPLFSQDELLHSIRAAAYPILFVEPVQYNWRFDVLDWHQVVAEINASPEPPIVILDTTLSGRSERLNAVLRMLGRSGCPLVVCVRSGLKLDQDGLELANLGVLEWWVREDLADRFARFETVAEACRVVSGAGVGWPEACALAPSFVLDPARVQTHSQAVFASNRMLAAQVRLGGELFAEKVYPEPPWDAPFVLLKLKDGSVDAYKRLPALLAAESRRRGLDWIMSGSFGFRTERFESILPAEQFRVGERPEGVLKIACGRYQGERFWQIVDLIEELATFDALDDAETRWRSRTLGMSS
jgi:hypothetical protein